MSDDMAKPSALSIELQAQLFLFGPPCYPTGRHVG